MRDYFIVILLRMAYCIVVKLFISFLFLIVFVGYSQLVIADDDDLTPAQRYQKEMKALRFNSQYSHQKTSENFLKNLSRDCKGFGFKKIDEDPTISPLKVLESYPKEIALKYFKENYEDLCFYGFSLGLKYLIKEYKNKLDDILNVTVMNCFAKEKSAKLCQQKNKEFFYNDLTPLLNTMCSKQSLKTFNKLYCEYKQLKKKKCDYYAAATYQKCPEYQAHLVDIESLFKLFHNKECKRFSKRKPRC